MGQRANGKVVAASTNSPTTEETADTGTKPSRRGRPRTDDPAKIEKFLGALRAGNSRPDSAKYSGIPVPTMYRWLSDPRPESASLNAAVVQAEAQARVTVVSGLFKLAKRSSRAALAWLRVHGGPEWRSKCSNCGAELGLHEAHEKLRGLAAEAIGRQAVANAAQSTGKAADIPVSKWSGTGPQYFVGVFDPASVVREYPELSKEWRWPISQMLSAAGMGTTPAQFFKRVNGVGPGLREDAEPRREWWELPIDHVHDPETPPGNA